MSTSLFSESFATCVLYNFIVRIVKFYDICAKGNNVPLLSILRFTFYWPQAVVPLVIQLMSCFQLCGKYLIYVNVLRWKLTPNTLGKQFPSYRMYSDCTDIFLVRGSYSNTYLSQQLWILAAHRRAHDQKCPFFARSRYIQALIVCVHEKHNKFTPTNKAES